MGPGAARAVVPVGIIVRLRLDLEQLEISAWGGSNTPVLQTFRAGYKPDDPICPISPTSHHVGEGFGMRCDESTDE